VVARILAGRGAHVRVVTLATEDDATEDTAHNLRLLHRLAEHNDTLAIDPFEDIRQLAAATPPDLVVDALLGIGVSGALRAPVDALARWANGQPAPVVAIDVPTGLDSTTGVAADDTVRADLTASSSTTGQRTRVASRSWTSGFRTFSSRRRSACRGARVARPMPPCALSCRCAPRRRTSIRRGKSSPLPAHTRSQAPR
jgi:hypothetical protein